MCDEPVAASHADGIVVIRFRSGHELSFPIRGNARLERGTHEELNAAELSPFGIHWPGLDEDLSFEGIMRGDYGQKRPGDARGSGEDRK